MFKIGAIRAKSWHLPVRKHLNSTYTIPVFPTMSAVKDVSGGLGQLKTLLASHDRGLSVVHFWADWAEQCGPMDEAMRVLAGEQELVRSY